MSKRKGNNPLANQPHFIQYAYLDLKNECECNDFLEYVKKSPEIQKLPFEPKLGISSIWQKEIFEVLDAWYNGDLVAKEKDKWINDNLPREILTVDNLSVLGEEIPRLGYNNLNLKGFLVKEITQVMDKGKKLGRCVECGRYFLPTPRGRNQIYCVSKCQHRAYMREYARKKSKNI